MVFETLLGFGKLGLVEEHRSDVGNCPKVVLAVAGARPAASQRFLFRSLFGVPRLVLRDYHPGLKYDADLIPVARARDHLSLLMISIPLIVAIDRAFGQFFLLVYNKNSLKK